MFNTITSSCQSSQFVSYFIFFSTFISLLFVFNRSDGLLGDAMHQQIIATFNCDLTTIDPALLRKGRLIAIYEFNKLDIETSKNLSDKLGFGIQNINEPMTLADIYNQDENVQEQTILNGQK